MKIKLITKSDEQIIRRALFVLYTEGNLGLGSRYMKDEDIHEFGGFTVKELNKLRRKFGLKGGLNVYNN